jgi:hypothetical protein
MYLSGLTHRDQLLDLTTRWLADRPDPEDGRTVTEVFAFERAITAPVVRRFVADLCRITHREEFYLERVTSKDQLREAIVAAAVHPTMRVEELIDWYRQLPEEFFPRTPVRMSLVTRRNGRLAAIVRRKRIRRIADKVSRLVALQLTGVVDEIARRLAASGPGRGVTSVSESARPPGISPGVRGAAERLVADRIRSGRLEIDPERARVDDIVGVKVIARQKHFEALEAALDELDYTWSFHRDVHEGPYVGNHYLVDLELPSDKSILERMEGIDWSFCEGRGLRIEDLPTRFRAYVKEARRTFRVELILTTFEDLVESEFGTSIHEQRILDQREQATEYVRIARNASSIIEYMLFLAISPTVRVDELPVKIWGRYIRDTVSHAIAELRGVAPTEWLVPGEHLEDLMRL